MHNILRSFTLVYIGMVKCAFPIDIQIETTKTPNNSTFYFPILSTTLTNMVPIIGRRLQTVANYYRSNEVSYNWYSDDYDNTIIKRQKADTNTKTLIQTRPVRAYRNNFMAKTRKLVNSSNLNPGSVKSDFGRKNSFSNPVRQISKIKISDFNQNTKKHVYGKITDKTTTTKTNRIPIKKNYKVIRSVQMNERKRTLGRLRSTKNLQSKPTRDSSNIKLMKILNNRTYNNTRRNSYSTKSITPVRSFKIVQVKKKHLKKQVKYTRANKKEGYKIPILSSKSLKEPQMISIINAANKTTLVENISKIPVRFSTRNFEVLRNKNEYTTTKLSYNRRKKIKAFGINPIIPLLEEEKTIKIKSTDKKNPGESSTVKTSLLMLGLKSKSKIPVLIRVE